MKAFTMTENKYRWHNDEYNGACIACGKIQHGGCEPDAREYTCESCDAKAVYGIEELLIMGLINFK